MTRSPCECSGLPFGRLPFRACLNAQRGPLFGSAEAQVDAEGRLGNAWVVSPADCARCGEVPDSELPRLAARAAKPRMSVDRLARARRGCVPCDAPRAPWEDLTWLQRWADAGADPKADFDRYLNPPPQPVLPGPPIYGWLHIGIIGAWEPILRELFSQVERSGLRAATSRVFVGVVGPEADLSWFPPWAEVVKRDGPPEKGENSTLEALWHWSKSAGPGKVWYAHTKGASHPGNRNVTAWRDYLTFWNVLRWWDRAADLETHDASGADYAEMVGDYRWFLDLWGALRLAPGDRGFPGNFWWATADYLATLPLDLGPARDRWWSEWKFVGTGRPRVRVAHDARSNHYNVIYPRPRYDAVASGSSPRPSATP